jgi:hypothetical protein
MSFNFMLNSIGLSLTTKRLKSAVSQLMWQLDCRRSSLAPEMDSKGTAEKVARDMAERYGRDAPRILRERAAVAEGYGDGSEARAWLNIANIAERIARRL